MSTFLRILAMTALFLAVGPPVGALTFAFVGGAGAVLTGQPPGTAGMILNGGLLGIALSWLIGGIQAAVAGFAMAAFAALSGRLSIVVAMLAGALTAAVYVAGEGLEPLFASLVVAVHIVPAGICGFIAKAIWGPRG